MNQHNKIYALAWIFCTTFAIGAPPVIVLIKGPGNSGKSSVAKEVVRDKKWCAIDEDAFYYDMFPDDLAQRFPPQYNAIVQVFEKYNIFHAVTRREYCFKDKVLEQDKEKALEAITYIESFLNGEQGKESNESFHKNLDGAILRAIDEAIMQNKNLLVDIWSKDSGDSIKERYAARMKKILLHCPMKRSFDFFKRRNETALAQKDLRQKRFWRQWIASYCKWYTFSSDQEKHFLSIIQKKDLDDIFATIEKDVEQSWVEQKEPRSSRREINLFDLAQCKKACYGHQESETYYLYPKEEYDRVFTVDEKETPASLASTIKKWSEEISASY